MPASKGKAPQPSEEAWTPSDENFGDAVTPSQESRDTPVSQDQKAKWHKPAILAKRPQLDEQQAALLEQKRLNRLPDNQAGPLAAHYEFMATIDPSSATFDESLFDVVPMPRGGYSQIAQDHMGSPPKAPNADTASNTEKAQYQSDMAEYQKHAEEYKSLLHRANHLTTRVDNKHVIGAPIRIFKDR